MNSKEKKETPKDNISMYSEYTKDTKFTLIAAVDENRVLGKDNQLIWHLPEDMKRFKRLTTGHAIIMGRKTFESLPKALPNRHNIVVTRNRDYFAEGITVCSSMEAAIEAVREDKRPYIIGGGQIYEQGLKFASIIELTKIHTQFEGDVFFPKIDLKKWDLVEEERFEHTEFDYSFLTYKKR